jgi:putative two-component system response regulator
VLKDVEFDGPIAQIVVQHHERLDGSGYPYGIPGKDILLEARILAVADVMVDMLSGRPDHPALGLEDVLAELAKGDGSLYDSEVVAACQRVMSRSGLEAEPSSSLS